MKRETISSALNCLDSRHISDTAVFAPRVVQGASERKTAMNRAYGKGKKRFVSILAAACLLLSPFTKEASALMLGVNLGGLGTLVASLASLISFRLYGAGVAKRSNGLFMGVFTGLNVLFLGTLLLLAWLLGAL